MKRKLGMPHRTGSLIMRRTLVCLLVFMPLCVTGASAESPHSQAPSVPAGIYGEYVIGPGDILEISVWKEPDLTRRVVVLPDGRISFPLIGQITAQGLSLTQLKAEIEKKILRYVPSPNLSVAVHQINSLHIYVLGKVNNPGRFELNTNVNILQALAMAGGFNPFAKRKEIKVIREGSTQTLIFEFNYDEVAKGKNLEQNRYLKRGDVIVVP